MIFAQKLVQNKNVLIFFVEFMVVFYDFLYLLLPVFTS